MYDKLNSGSRICAGLIAGHEKGKEVNLKYVFYAM
jgi:hypothetical protein